MRGIRYHPWAGEVGPSGANCKSGLLTLGGGDDEHPRAERIVVRVNKNIIAPVVVVVELSAFALWEKILKIGTS